jgi:hypothetical protein
MAIPLDKLSNIDYKILHYIGKFDSISKEKLKKRFSKINHLDYRLSLLSKIELRDTGYVSIPIENSNYIQKEFEANPNDPASPVGIAKNSFRITDYGKATLLNHSEKVKADRKSFWMRSILTPILVAVATTLAVQLVQHLLTLIK